MPGRNIELRRAKPLRLGRILPRIVDEGVHRGIDTRIERQLDAAIGDPVEIPVRVLGRKSLSAGNEHVESGRCQRPSWRRVGARIRSHLRKQNHVTRAVHVCRDT